jgi:hypothetical protein
MFSGELYSGDYDALFSIEDVEKLGIVKETISCSYRKSKDSPEDPAVEHPNSLLVVYYKLIYFVFEIFPFLVPVNSTIVHILYCVDCVRLFGSISATVTM